MAPPSLVLLLPLLAVAAEAVTRTSTLPSNHTAAGAGAPPVPTPWPEQFHAVMFTNLTESGGQLQVIDLYYDWPNGRNLNLIRNQLSGDPKYDVEWTNGTSYIFDSASCRTIRFPVGILPPNLYLIKKKKILPPNWLDGAVYLGRETTDGFDCHLWTKVDFVWYYEDVVTRRPVRWNFYTGMQQHVMSFEVGGVLEDSHWQAPAHCFAGGATTATRADDEANVLSSLLRFPEMPAAAAA